MPRRLASLLALVLPALCAPAAAQALCAAHPTLRDGHYVNIDPNSRAIAALDLGSVCGSVRRDHGGGLGSVTHGADPHWSVRLWGACSPRACDWGATRGQENAARSFITASYDQGFARRSVRIIPVGPDEVILRVRSSYADGRAARVFTDRLRRR